MDETDLSEGMRSKLERQASRELRIFRQSKGKLFDDAARNFEGIAGKGQLRGTAYRLFHEATPVPA